MNAVDTLRRQLTCNDWANHEVVRSLRAAGDVVPEARRLLAHVLGAERVWLARLRGEPSPLAVWPELGLDECEALLPELAHAWDEHFAAGDAAALSRRVTYRNSRGETFTNEAGDILAHVLLHGAHHRGQIAAAMRAAGCAPASTDYILGQRRGALERS